MTQLSCCSSTLVLHIMFAPILFTSFLNSHVSRTEEILLWFFNNLHALMHSHEKCKHLNINGFYCFTEHLSCWYEWNPSDYEAEKRLFYRLWVISWKGFQMEHLRFNPKRNSKKAWHHLLHQERKKVSKIVLFPTLNQVVGNLKIPFH